MKTVEASKVPAEVIKSLTIQNIKGWRDDNKVTYLPKGDNPNIETNQAVVYHQLEDGSYVIKDRYEF